MKALTDIILKHIVSIDIKELQNRNTLNYYDIQKKYAKAFGIVYNIKTIYYNYKYNEKTIFEYKVKNKKNLIFLIEGIKANVFSVNSCINKILIKKESDNKYILKVIYNNEVQVFINILL